jgi:hypothetical protein
MQTETATETKAAPMDPTKQKLIEMLTYNSGTHFLDSGGDSGRHWQRNRGRDFESEPASSVEFSTWGRKGGEPKAEIVVTHNVYHWLSERLSYAEDLDKLFHRWCSLVPEMREKNWLGCAQTFAERMIATERAEDESYGGGKGGETINTYNGENLLSQVLQFTELRINGTDYVILSIHGGADVRGGYSIAHVFEVTEEAGMYDVTRASISCDKCRAYWTTDDGSHWYAEGACGLGAKTQLEKYDVKVLDTSDPQVTCSKDEEPHTKHQHEGSDPLCNFAEELTAVDMWEAGKLCIVDRKGLCPRCGGNLNSYFY